MNANTNGPVDGGRERQVLFLDYDGTIHRGPSYRTRRGIVSSDPKQIRLFEFAPLVDELLAPYPDLEIVLSTSWVSVVGFDRAKECLPTSLQRRVRGATYHSKYADALAWSTIGRGIQILRYVRVHRLKRWLAVDDCIDGLDGLEEHVVKCEEHLGLGNRETRGLLLRRLAEQFGER
ncbi:hypothetical protein B0G80_6036 [Paraburkholderia sp. BL6669N2]|uniref:HAD domain-containing protein n=1 Tax=Paraburkholderia sp. BL6669N2 TaxID=1938807 RepID=UPI000E22FF02|nr:HAD domain-containing protein [Paraburkholderia sp. BL6669N2]REG49638.1 hypothetical protein B0G80_6036 [Paraburkholderia sp. BL6669N2]